MKPYTLHRSEQSRWNKCKSALKAVPDVVQCHEEPHLQPQRKQIQADAGGDVLVLHTELWVASAWIWFCQYNCFASRGVSVVLLVIIPLLTAAGGPYCSTSQKVICNCTSGIHIHVLLRVIYYALSLSYDENKVSFWRLLVPRVWKITISSYCNCCASLFFFAFFFFP